MGKRPPQMSSDGYRGLRSFRDDVEREVNSAKAETEEQNVTIEEVQSALWEMVDEYDGVEPLPDDLFGLVVSEVDTDSVALPG